MARPLRTNKRLSGAGTGMACLTSVALTRRLVDSTSRIINPLDVVLTVLLSSDMNLQCHAGPDPRQVTPETAFRVHAECQM